MAPDGLEHRIRATACIELAQDIRDLVLGRADRDAQVTGELLVRVVGEPPRQRPGQPRGPTIAKLPDREQAVERPGGVSGQYAE